MTIPGDRDSQLAAVRASMRTALKLSEAEAAAVTLDSTPLQFPQWTSMVHLELVLAIEQQCDVAFEAEEIGELASVAAIVAALDRRRPC